MPRFRRLEKVQRERLRLALDDARLGRPGPHQGLLNQKPAPAARYSDALIIVEISLEVGTFEHAFPFGTIHRFCRQPGGSARAVPRSSPRASAQAAIRNSRSDRLASRATRLQRGVEQCVSLCLRPAQPGQRVPTDAMAITVEQLLRPFDQPPVAAIPEWNRPRPPRRKRREKVSPAFRMRWVVARRLAACQVMPRFSKIPHEQCLSVATEEGHDQVAASESCAVILRPRLLPHDRAGPHFHHRVLALDFSGTRPPLLDLIRQIQRHALKPRSACSRIGVRGEPTWHPAHVSSGKLDRETDGEPADS